MKQIPSVLQRIQSWDGSGKPRKPRKAKRDRELEYIVTLVYVLTVVGRVVITRTDRTRLRSIAKRLEAGPAMEKKP